MRTFLFILSLFLISCSGKDKRSNEVNPFEERIKLLEADKAFSRMSEENGMKNAFIEYIDSNGVLLRPGYTPIQGANAIDYLIQQDDTGFTFKWQPHNAVVSAQGDMGFTYGVYAIEPRNDSITYGTYVTIWKRQQDGSWKFILDSGNEGIGDY